MSDNGRSERDFFGDINHYDSHGNKTGHSERNFFGGYTNYDSHGNKIGHSDRDLFGGYSHYDNHGHKTGHSDRDLFGGYSHKDSHGNKTGHSSPGMFGSYHHDDQGCYVATCVYGSYDCPQVWTLRRFRDNTLAASVLGRAFIRTYYAISPTIVRWFGNTRWFKKAWQSVLDKMVKKLNNNGVESTPYNDRRW